MKKSLKIAAFTGIAFLFCLVVSTTTASAISANIPNTQKENPEKTKVNATDTSMLLCFSTRSKVNLSVPENNTNPTVKKLDSPLFVHTKTVERVFNVLFSQYTFHSKNVLYRLKLIDSLYPFHHFW